MGSITIESNVLLLLLHRIFSITITITCTKCTNVIYYYYFRNFYITINITVNPEFNVIVLYYKYYYMQL